MTEDLERLPRVELDDVARDAGVPDPEGLPNKQAVIAAMPNPALASEPPPPEGPRRFRVIGPRTVMDTAPGDEFDADLPTEQERTLTEAGHITRVTQGDE